MKKKIIITTLVINLIFISSLNIPIFSQSSELLGKVNKSKINVRTDSRVNAPSLGYLTLGETVQILGEQFNWYKIILPERFFSYAYATYLKKKNNKQVEVTANILNLRSSPSMEASIIGKVKKGDILHPLENYGEWIKLKCYPHAHGWVHKKFIDTVSIEAKKPIEKSTSEDIVKPLSLDDFHLKGIISELKPLQDCQANYKLKKGDLCIFFLKINKINNIEDFVNKEVTIKGTRQYNGCTYIDVESILGGR